MSFFFILAISLSVVFNGLLMYLKRWGMWSIIKVDLALTLFPHSFNSVSLKDFLQYRNPAIKKDFDLNYFNFFFEYCLYKLVKFIFKFLGYALNINFWIAGIYVVVTKIYRAIDNLNNSSDKKKKSIKNDNASSIPAWNDDPEQLQLGKITTNKSENGDLFSIISLYDVRQIEMRCLHLEEIIQKNKSEYDLFSEILERRIKFLIFPFVTFVLGIFNLSIFNYWDLQKILENDFSWLRFNPKLNGEIVLSGLVITFLAPLFHNVLKALLAGKKTAEDLSATPPKVPSSENSSNKKKKKK